MKKSRVFILVFLLYVTVHPSTELNLQENNPSEGMAIVTYVTDHQQVKLAEVLIKSLRTFGGPHADCPVYVVMPEDTPFDLVSLESRDVFLVKIDIDEPILRYPFAFKALAAAKGETLAIKKYRTLVWLDPGVIVLNRLDDLDLGKTDEEAVLRTVSLNNRIGLTREEKPDDYWNRIYQETGLAYENVPYLETIVDRVAAKAYMNCQVYAVNPALGLLKKWAAVLEKLIRDTQYQSSACPHYRQKIFLHQAVFSGVVISGIPDSKIRTMSLRSNYPVSHHKEMKAAIQMKRLNDVRVAVFDERWKRDPNWMDIMPVDQPLKQWLEQAYMDYLMIADHLYRQEGSCNSYLITTSDGSILIDPNGASGAPRWFKKIMTASPLKYILITHAHPDHWDNMDVWRTDSKIKIVAQREFVDRIRYTDRLAGFFARRNAIWGRKPIPKDTVIPKKTKIEPTILFRDQHRFDLGGFHIELFHMSGECQDHSLIWVPELSAVFAGDNYYRYFINNSTFRGSNTRPILGYINAMEKALSLNPTYFLPGHDRPVIGKDHIRRTVSRFHNTLKFIHEKTVEGMNKGNDVHTLMQTITLPPELQIAPFYGKVSWTVRGIYNEYAGWFDENPASMYALPPSGIYPEMVQLAGGVDRIASKARELLEKGEYVKTLHLTAVALGPAPQNPGIHRIRLEALEKLKQSTFNYIERIWLDFGIRQCQKALKIREPASSDSD